MRVLLAPEGTRGDVQPTLALASGLRQAGHMPTVVGPPECADLAPSGVAYVATRQSMRELMDRAAPAIAGGGDLAILREGRRLLLDAVVRQFEELRPHVERSQLAIGAGLQAALPSLCEALGVPYRYLVYCPGLLPSAEHPPAGIGMGPRPTPRRNRLAWRLVPRAFHWMLGRPIDRERRKLGLPRVASLFDHVLTFEPWVATDPLLAPVPSDLDRDHRQIGFLYREEGPPLPEKLEHFLDAGPPPVYVGFGSMTDPDPAATTRLVLEVAERLGTRLVLSSGWAGLGEGPLPENVFSVGPVCHHRLFRRLAAVVHHGGAGTTSTAARAGVPQVFVPHGVDQPYWAHRAWQAGISPGSLRRRELDADRLAQLVAACTQTDLIAERARELGAALRAREPGHRSAWPDLLTP